jgi:hypothetical protein
MAITRLRALLMFTSSLIQDWQAISKLIQGNRSILE